MRHCRTDNQVPDWYLRWCAENADMQEWWRAITDGAANMSPGDRYSHGACQQYGWITRIVYNIALDRPDYLTIYHEGSRGGFMSWHHSVDKRSPFNDGYFVWVPWVHQVAKWNKDIAMRLIMDADINESEEEEK